MAYIPVISRAKSDISKSAGNQFFFGLCDDSGAFLAGGGTVSLTAAANTDTNAQPGVYPTAVSITGVGTDFVNTLNPSFRGSFIYFNQGGTLGTTATSMCIVVVTTVLSATTARGFATAATVTAFSGLPFAYFNYDDAGFLVSTKPSENPNSTERRHEGGGVATYTTTEPTIKVDLILMQSGIDVMKLMETLDGKFVKAFYNRSYVGEKYQEYFYSVGKIASEITTIFKYDTDADVPIIFGASEPDPDISLGALPLTAIANNFANSGHDMDETWGGGRFSKYRRIYSAVS